MFPFNNPDTQNNAYKDISDKFENLENPTLFLTNLKKITYSTEKLNGRYELESLETREIEPNTHAERIRVHYDDTDETDNIWLFSRKTDNNLEYSVGFWIDNNLNFIPWNKDRAYCYFTTKEDTHLNFIIHAPFSLTQNRANIKAGNDHNKNLIQLLAELAGDALLYFRDMSTEDHHYITDKIFDLIPLDEKIFGDIDNSENISFKPFYTEIRKRFETDCLMPGINKCVSKDHAYWASTAQIMELFSTEQLKEITDDSEAEWILSQFGRNSNQGNKIRNYVDGLIHDYFDEEVQSKNILNKIDSDFIEHQDTTWLLKFYQWCSETYRRKIEALTRPIILNQDNKAVLAQDVFLPDDSIKDLPTVSPMLIANNEIKSILQDKFGIKKPDRLDYIERIIIPRYPKFYISYYKSHPCLESIVEQAKKDYIDIFKYYISRCTIENTHNFTSKLQNIAFILYKDNNKYHLAQAKDLHFFDEDLKLYHEYTNIDYNHISIDDFKGLLSDESMNCNIDKVLTDFFLSLGIHSNTLDVIEKTYCNPNRRWGENQYGYGFECYPSDLRLLYTPCDDAVPHTRSSKGNRKFDEWVIARYEGLCELVSDIQKTHSKEKSFFLWRFLAKHSEIIDEISHKNCSYVYIYRGTNDEKFYSPDYYQLKTAPWIVQSDGTFVSAQDYNPGGYWSNEYDWDINYFGSHLNKSQLSSEYDLSSPGAQKLCSFLGIREPPVVIPTPIVEEPEPMDEAPEEDDDIEDEDDDIEEEPETAEDQIKRLEEQLASKDEQLASKDAELESKTSENERLKAELADIKRKEEERRLRRECRQQKSQVNNYSNNRADRISTPSNIDDVIDPENDEETDTDIIDIEEDSLPRRIMRQVRHYVRESKPSENNSILAVKTNKTAKSEQKNDDDDNDDCDEYIPTPVNYRKRIASAEQTAIRKIGELDHLDKLQKMAQQANKYSFGWFKALIELEAIQSDETSQGNQKISISFGKVEREPKTERTLILRQPNKPIPLFMEELADITLTLHDSERQYSVIIEAASIRSYTLRVKLRSMDALKDIDLNTITEAHIEAQSPAFLWKELLNGYENLPFNNGDDLQKLLPQNLEFVFGPPGTGKTTYLANQFLIPWMQFANKILVLTPTNKAADVIVSRIISIMGEDRSYREWLIRFGTTADETIEKSELLHDSSLNIDALDKCVIVTTIARFPYDYCLNHGNRILLSDMNWDCLVIDEASMIPVANIVYPIFKSKPHKFIIAGDPFQIEPIANIDLWAGENIYKMTELNAFREPKTTPHQYPVILLTTQYRSIPEIGNVFSNFKYDGIIKHHREAHTQKLLNIDIEFDALNLIKFPVKRYESIYRCKRLNQSSNYQIYSALFTYEFVCFIARKIALHHTNGEPAFRIGVISPYRVQADLIAKLIASEKLPEAVEVLVGTIHSFQGDECDMVFAVFNPPENITPNSFVNRDNILNVSISRARDYLCIVMPDDETQGIEKLTRIKAIERLMHDSSKVKEFQSKDLETMMFGNSSFLEDNAFSTSHQSVNVYKEPERIYEIRSEATAIDIQVHKAGKTKT